MKNSTLGTPSNQHGVDDMLAIPMPVSPVPAAVSLAKYETSSCPAVHSVTGGADVLVPSLVVVLSVDGELEHPAAQRHIAANTAPRR